MKSVPWVFSLTVLLIIPGVHSYIDWDGNWDGGVEWSEVPVGIVVGPGVGNAQGTDFCDVVRNQSYVLKEALNGRNLSVAVQYGPGFDFFEYKPEEELSSTNPRGMVADMLDELAERGGFSWRNSFVAYNTTSANVLVGKGAGKWDRMLKLTTKYFDLSVDKWILTAERLENQTVFLNSWFDSSLILVDQADKLKITWLSFATPFETDVWAALAATVLMSALFMIIIESLEDRRDGRTIKEWFSDHLYLTTLAFSQQFVFINPVSAAGRVFLSSFAFWAMLIGATYTANLASLLVENGLASPINSIESAMAAKLSICIHEGSASQTIMEQLHPKLRNYPSMVYKADPNQMYASLKSGECEILIGTRQEFQIFGNMEEYGCNLVETGDELHSGTASFAIEFDPLNCDSVLAYVLNLHLYEMTLDGMMDEFWDNYLNSRDDTCATTEGRRLKETDKEDFIQSRQLGVATKAASANNNDSETPTASLNLTGMAGVFLVHGVGTAIAILISIYSHLKKCSTNEQDRQKRIFGVDSSRIAKTESEQKYDTLKADMMSQMDRFFAEHQQGLHRKSEIQMRSIIDARQSMVKVARGSIMVAPGTPPDRNNSRYLDLSASGRTNASYLNDPILRNNLDLVRPDSLNESEEHTFAVSKANGESKTTFHDDEAIGDITYPAHSKTAAEEWLTL